MSLLKPSDEWRLFRHAAQLLVLGGGGCPDDTKFVSSEDVPAGVADLPIVPVSGEYWPFSPGEPFSPGRPSVHLDEPDEAIWTIVPGYDCAPKHFRHPLTDRRRTLVADLRHAFELPTWSHHVGAHISVEAAQVLIADGWAINDLRKSEAFDCSSVDDAQFLIDNPPSEWPAKWWGVQRRRTWTGWGRFRPDDAFRMAREGVDYDSACDRKDRDAYNVRLSQLQSRSFMGFPV